MKSCEPHKVAKLFILL